MNTTIFQDSVEKDGVNVPAVLADGPYNITVKIVLITREIAKLWLTKSGPNRSIRSNNLRRLIRALQAGQWEHVNGETIVFGSDGSLMDGQHRLQAVVQSGVPITSLVVWGVEPHKRSTIDTGMARALADYLSMNGYPSGRNLAATVMLHAKWEQGNLSEGGDTLSVFPTYESGVDHLRAHEGLVESLRRARRMPRLQSVAQLAVLDYLFEHKDRVLHGRWMTTMISGVAHERAMNFLYLRERLMRDSTERVTRPIFEHFAYQLKAWNASRKNRVLRVYKMRDDEPIPPLD